MFLTPSELRTSSRPAGDNHGDHASFIIEASEPAAAPTLPEPREPDFARLGDLARRHGQEILVHSRDDPQPVLYERRLTLAHD